MTFLTRSCASVRTRTQNRHWYMFTSGCMCMLRYVHNLCMHVARCVRLHLTFLCLITGCTSACTASICKAPPVRQTTTLNTLGNPNLPEPLAFKAPEVWGSGQSCACPITSRLQCKCVGGLVRRRRYVIYGQRRSRNAQDLEFWVRALESRLKTCWFGWFGSACHSPLIFKP